MPTTLLSCTRPEWSKRRDFWHFLSRQKLQVVCLKAGYRCTNCQHGLLGRDDRLFRFVLEDYAGHFLALGPNNRRSFIVDIFLIFYFF